MATTEPHAYIGEVLVRRGVIPPERLPGLFDSVRERGQPLTELVVMQNVADETQIAQALADEAGLGFVPKIDVDAIPLELATKLPITYAKQRRVLPVSDDGLAVHCIVADPFDTMAIDDVRATFGKPVEVSVATNEGVLNAINRVY